MPSTSKDDTDKDDTDKDDTDTGPVDQNPDVDGYQSTPPKDIVTPDDDTAVTPDTVPIVPPVVSKPKANVTVDPNAKPTTTKKKDTSRKVRPGMKGSGKQPARWNWKGPEFNPANFRDPLNLKKYKAVGNDAVVGSIANKKQF